MKVSDLHNIANGRYDLVHKSVGVLLHDSGFMRYRKLTPENYLYWWYEVDDPIAKICPCCSQKITDVKRLFTYEWADMEQTSKFDFLIGLLKYHKSEEDLHKVINIALNLDAAKHDGIDIDTGRSAYDFVFDMYYSGWKPEPKQITLFN